MEKTFIMQKDDAYSPAFVLQTLPTLQEAKDLVFRLMVKRDKQKLVWPVWTINGIKY